MGYIAHLGLPPRLIKFPREQRDKDGFRVPRPVVKRGSSHHEDEPFIRLASEIHVARDDLVDIQTMRNMSNSNPDLQNIGRPPIKCVLRVEG